MHERGMLRRMMAEFPVQRLAIRSRTASGMRVVLLEGGSGRRGRRIDEVLSVFLEAPQMGRVIVEMHLQR